MTPSDWESFKRKLWRLFFQKQPITLLEQVRSSETSAINRWFSVSLRRYSECSKESRRMQWASPSLTCQAHVLASTSRRRAIERGCCRVWQGTCQKSLRASSKTTTRTHSLTMGGDRSQVGRTAKRSRWPRHKRLHCRWSWRSRRFRRLLLTIFREGKSMEFNLNSRLRWWRCQLTKKISMEVHLASALFLK